MKLHERPWVHSKSTREFFILKQAASKDIVDPVITPHIHPEATVILQTLCCHESEKQEDKSGASGAPSPTRLYCSLSLKQQMAMQQRKRQ